MQRAREYLVLVARIDDYDGASDSGCDSADEFVAVGDLEALRLHLAIDSDDDCSDWEGEARLGGSLYKWTACFSPDGSSRGDGSAEGELSDGSVCVSPEKLGAVQENHCTSTTFSGDGEDSETVLSEDSPCQSPEIQTSGERTDCSCSTGNESSGGDEPRDRSTR